MRSNCNIIPLQRLLWTEVSGFQIIRHIRVKQIDNVHLDLRITWLEFSSQRFKVMLLAITQEFTQELTVIGLVGGDI